jgi:DNA polymerase-3 subunit delta
MYRVEFENLLSINPPKAVLFYGENSYQISSYIGWYIKNVGGNYQKYHFEEYNFQSARGYLSQTSLFGGGNLLILKREKKIPLSELKALLELVARGRNNYFIFEYLGRAGEARSLHGEFSKNGAVWVRLFKPNIDEVVSILRRETTHMGLDIDHYTLQYLAITLNMDLSLCINELNKLTILGRRVVAEDIDNLVYSTAPLAMEQLLTELFKNRPIDGVLKGLFRTGESEFAILHSTQLFLNQIFLFSSYYQLHGKIDSKAILGYSLPKHIMEARVSIALKMDLNSILKIYELLLESEPLIKRSSPNIREGLLYGVFTKLQSYLSSP